MNENGFIHNVIQSIVNSNGIKELVIIFVVVMILKYILDLKR